MRGQLHGRGWWKEPWQGDWAVVRDRGDWDSGECVSVCKESTVGVARGNEERKGNEKWGHCVGRRHWVSCWFVGRHRTVDKLSLNCFVSDTMWWSFTHCYSLLSLTTRGSWPSLATDVAKDGWRHKGQWWLFKLCCFQPIKMYMRHFVKLQLKTQQLNFYAKTFKNTF